MARKNISDIIHGDRALIRGGQIKKLDDEWPTTTSSTVGYGLSQYYDSKEGKAHKHTSSCYSGHKALKLPGTDLVIYGGSCGHPIVKDADVYIGFDQYSMRQSPRSWPWKKGVEFCFPIKDMCAPDDAAEFIKLIDWTLQQLKEGKKIHAGCIGGHGRTGTFLSAVVSKFGESDATTYVRDNYCSRAVESSAQMKFLNQHFGVKITKGSKDFGGKSSYLTIPKTADNRFATFPPLAKNGSVWEAVAGYEWVQE